MVQSKFCFPDSAERAQFKNVGNGSSSSNPFTTSALKTPDVLLKGTVRDAVHMYTGVTASAAAWAS